MKIETFADLERAMRLCRKQGITRIEIDGIKLEFAEAPQRARRAASSDKDKPETEQPFDEQALMFWSSEPQV